MKKFLLKTSLLLLSFLFVSSGLMAQNTVWDPASFDGSVGLWINPGNWTNGLPGATVSKTVFNVDGAMDCIVDEDVTSDDLELASLPKIVQGDGGPGGNIIIQEGGALTTAEEWSGIGWSGLSKLYVEEGGEITFGQHMWIGWELEADGTEVHIDGGTLNVNGMFGMDWQGKGVSCTLYLNSGLLSLSNIHNEGKSMGENAKIEYAGGTMQITGDHKEVLETLYTDKIVGDYEIWVEENVAGEDTTYMTKLSNEGPTSINDMPVEEVSVFPNPANNYLNVSMTNDVIQSVQIFDLSGRIADSFVYGNAKEATIYTQSIVEGVYIVKVKGKKYTDFERIIIKR